MDFFEKPILLLAPDAKIFINSSFKLEPLDQNDSSISTLVNQSNVDASVFQGAYTNTVDSMDINNFYNSFSVDMSLEGDSSASVSFTFNKYEFTLLKRGLRTTFIPMSEISIYAKGRFLDKQGKPLYYRIFWGVILRTSTTESHNQYNVSLTCESMMYWWKNQFLLDEMSSSLSLFLSSNGRDYNGTSDLATKFINKTVYEVVYTVAKSIGLPNITIDSSLVLSGSENIKMRELFREKVADIREYWHKRLKVLENNIRMFGVKSVEKKEPIKEDNPEIAINTQAQINIELESYIDDYIPSLIPNITSNLQNNYVSKYELVKTMADKIQYEFYTDRTGEFVFKPPFYNMTISPNNKIYNIEPLDIISFSFSENISNVYNRVDVSGAVSKTDISRGTIYSFYIDMESVRKLGFISTAPKIEANFLTSTKQAYYYCVGILSRLNASYISGSLTLKGRPELRLGLPVRIFDGTNYLYLYVTSMSHSFSVGGSFDTSLTFIGARYPFSNPTKGSNKNVYLKYSHGDDEKYYADDEDEKYRQKFGEWEYSEGGDPSFEALTKNIPISDEEGYTLVGAFPYGRNYEISEDNFIRRSKSRLEVDGEDLIDENTELPPGILDLGGGVAELSEMRPDDVEDQDFKEILKKIRGD